MRGDRAIAACEPAMNGSDGCLNILMAGDGFKESTIL